jgi:hypothetical protein
VLSTYSFSIAALGLSLVEETRKQRHNYDVAYRASLTPAPCHIIACMCNLTHVFPCACMHRWHLGLWEELLAPDASSRASSSSRGSASGRSSDAHAAAALADVAGDAAAAQQPAAAGHALTSSAAAGAGRDGSQCVDHATDGPDSDVADGPDGPGADAAVGPEPEQPAEASAPVAPR